MKRINIRSNGQPYGTIVTDEDGKELPHIKRVTAVFEDEGVSAQVEFAIPNTIAEADATVSEEHLKELAAAHGYKLSKK